MRTMIEEEEKEAGSEITLGMTSLLGIFLGLVLICGVFFGFGYSLGHSKNSTAATPPATSSAIASEETAPAPSTIHIPKPSAQETTASTAGDAAGKSPQYEYIPEEGGPARRPVTGQTAAVSTTPKPSPAAKPPATQTQPPTTPFALQPAVISTATTPPPALKKAAATAAAVQPAAAMGGATMVQIAAVSHQEDADVLVSALKKRGYSVVVRNESQDKLLHVQVGPFTSRDEAKTMRSKLQSDGYNAILKP